MDLTADGSLLLAQLGRIVAEEPPSEGVVAIYFGLFEAVDRDDGPSRPALYVSGSTRSPDGWNWNGWDSGSWLPAGRYFALPTLADGDPAAWEAIEDAVAALLIRHRSAIDRLLGTDRRPLAVGWDEGEPRLL